MTFLKPPLFGQCWCMAKPFNVLNGETLDILVCSNLKWYFKTAFNNSREISFIRFEVPELHRKPSNAPLMPYLMGCGQEAEGGERVTSIYGCCIDVHVHRPRHTNPPDGFVGNAVSGRGDRMHCESLCRRIYHKAASIYLAIIGGVMGNMKKRGRLREFYTINQF